MSAERLNFCTLFNKSYLSRGIVMIESLFRHEPTAQLYVLAFDSFTANVLRDRDYANVEVVELHQFEDDALLAVKPQRTMAEYCWTCTPAIVLYCIDQYKLNHCTYIDADLVFYDSPQVLWDELGDSSVFITEHRYTEKYDQSSDSGIYCVQYITFKNDTRGCEALEWWRDACLIWCYNRKEDGKFGDQKYLDDWTERFEGVHVMQHLGAGLAPWNLQQYEVSLEGERVALTHPKGTASLVFFHFHHVTLLSSGYVHFGPYDLDVSDRRHLYEPYAREVIQCELELLGLYPTVKLDNRLNDSWFYRRFSKRLKKRLRPLTNQSLNCYG